MQPSPDEVDRLANACTLIVGGLLVLEMLVAYFGRKLFGAAGWVHGVFYCLGLLSILAIIYFGWVKRVMSFGRSGSFTATGAQAVAASVVYLAVALALLAGGWNAFK